MRHVTHIQWLDASDYASAVVIADEEGAGIPPAIDALRGRASPWRGGSPVRPGIAAPSRRARLTLVG